MLPEHYKKAIEYIDKAMDALYCMDNENKTVGAFYDLRRIKETLEQKE